jgi:hypothetical protein
MAETAPHVPQTSFVILERTLGPGVAKYQNAIGRFVRWRSNLNAQLSSFDEAMNAVESPEEAAAVKAARDEAYDALVSQNPPPPNPNLEPGVTDEDKRLYHTLEKMILERGRADLENMIRIAQKIEAVETKAIDDYLATIEDEIAKKEARDRKAAREQRRAKARGRYTAFAGQVVSTVLSVIPTGVTQVIGAALSIATEVGKAVWDVDVARKYAHALRNNANWLVYEQPKLLDALDKSDWNVNYSVALVDIGEATRESITLRNAITDEKLATGIWDEAELAASKRRKTPALIRTAAFIGAGLLAVRWIFK